MFCENCGYSIPKDSKFCASCGSKVEMESAPELTQRQTTNPTHGPNGVGQSSGISKTQSPSVYEPQLNEQVMGVGEYIVTLLLIMIPILGIILLFKWSFSESVNLNKKNMARAYLIFFAIWFIIIFVGGGVLMGVLEAIMR